MESYNYLSEFSKNIKIEPSYVCSINKEGLVLEHHGEISGMTEKESDIYISSNYLGISSNPISNFSRKTYNRLFDEVKKIIDNDLDVEEKLYLNIGKDKDSWYEIEVKKDPKDDTRALLIWFKSLYLNNLRENSIYELEMYKNLFNSYNICICVNGRIKFISNKAVEFLGGKCWSEFLGKRMKDFISKDSKLDIDYALNKISGNIRDLDFSEVIRRLDFSEVDVKMKMIPVYFNGESGVQIVFKKEKIENRIKELERLIYLKNIELDEFIQKERQQTEFFIDISHDLRTPSNVILGAIQLLRLQIDKKTIKDEGGRLDEYLSIIKFNALRLLRLTNNIIDITKFDSGFSELQLKKCNLVSFVEGIISSVIPYIENKNIKVTFDTDKEDIYLLIDPSKMERVILNIMSNAIKFTPKGGEIFVSIKCTDTIDISIRDSGIGMGEEKMKTIFERFSQVNGGFIKNYEGSGIGLSLSKSIIDQHGGKIKVESELNKGSNFIISFPKDKIKVSDSDIDLFEHQLEALDIELADICYQK